MMVRKRWRRWIFVFFGLGSEVQLDLFSRFPLQQPSVLLFCIFTGYLLSGIPLRPGDLLPDQSLLPLLISPVLPFLLPDGILPSQSLGAIVNPGDMQALLQILHPADTLPTQMLGELGQRRPPGGIHVDMFLVRDILLVEMVHVDLLLAVSGPE